MKKKLGFVIGLLFLLQSQAAHAQLGVAEVIKAGVKKVIVALDLKVQRLQNETIWLQNAQKTMENLMSKLKLEEISTWTEKQRSIYADYFQELSKVKSYISYYASIREITQRQYKLLSAYRKAWNLLQADEHFSVAEINYMAKVYAGILEESLKNIDQLTIVITAFEVRMTDAERLVIIRKAAAKSEENYSDLMAFNQQNILLSLARSRDKKEQQQLKILYGIEN